MEHDVLGFVFDEEAWSHLQLAGAKKIYDCVPQISCWNGVHA